MCRWQLHVIPSCQSSGWHRALRRGPESLYIDVIFYLLLEMNRESPSLKWVNQSIMTYHSRHGLVFQSFHCLEDERVLSLLMRP